MCASCIGQGVLYLGGAVGGLKVMAYRAGRRTGRDTGAAAEATAVDGPAVDDDLTTAATDER